jgi:hypothetical protein
MGRRIFLSFGYEDKAQASGFALLQWNPNVDFEFVGRHLLSPADSDDPVYIRQKIRERLQGTSVTVVLIGQHTAESDWVYFEIRESLQKGNAVVGIRLKDSGNPPIPPAMREVGCKVINWEPDGFSDEIERQALVAGRPELGPAPIRSGRPSNCAR